ncbi:hypothetical protein FACS1894189_1500 [Planctomycetales bacterium]|nr:hypothetical protein FACS1894189_1500 [Planctomycetales bacterium]
MKVKPIFALFLFLTVYATGLFAQESVEKVHVIFKTHLDIGYTDLASKVEQRYITEFIPKAIAVGNQLRAEGSKDRYIWTTGAWLIAAYLQQATPEAVKELEEAIQRGNIVWNGVPYTVESESMSKDLFETILRLSQRLDKRFGKKTIAARMSDVPGHTRGIISPLSDADIRLLEVGVNNQCTAPKVPPLCTWRNTDGKEIILMQRCYGEYEGETILPGGKSAVSVQFTGDNHGPHTIKQVQNIYAALRKKYPKADVFSSNFNDVAEVVSTMASQLPVVTSEIGDTWIWGYASSPVMMSKYRALSRLYSDWVKTGKIDPKSDIAVDYAVRLGMVAEHTWGLAHNRKHYDKQDFDIFSASRDMPEFRRSELSWKEKADNVDKAIALLPENLQTEAKASIKDIGNVTPLLTTASTPPKQMHIGTFNNSGGLQILASDVTYQTFSANDYTAFLKAYCRGKYAIYPNACFGNPQLENTKAQSASITAGSVSETFDMPKLGTDVSHAADCILSFPRSPAIDKRALPEQVSTSYTVSEDGKRMDLTVSLVNKPANRLPEAYWFSFVQANIKEIIVEKMGCRVNVLDVVESGNRQMHCIDNYVDLVTDKGTIRITSLDAPVVAIGERNALNYSASQPDITKGVHFCLINNLWATNFTLWWEGSISYRFKIEMVQTN